LRRVYLELSNTKDEQKIPALSWALNMQKTKRSLAFITLNKHISWSTPQCIKRIRKLKEAGEWVFNPRTQFTTATTWLKYRKITKNLQYD